MVIFMFYPDSFSTVTRHCFYKTFGRTRNSALHGGLVHLAPPESPPSVLHASKPHTLENISCKHTRQYDTNDRHFYERISKVLNSQRFVSRCHCAETSTNCFNNTWYEHEGGGGALLLSACLLFIFVLLIRFMNGARGGGEEGGGGRRSKKEQWL